eukprot:6198479-Pleurochrysis_carterae.AAC.1
MWSAAQWIAAAMTLLGYRAGVSIAGHNTTQPHPMGVPVKQGRHAPSERRAEESSGRCKGWCSKGNTSRNLNSQPSMQRRAADLLAAATWSRLRAPCMDEAATLTVAPVSAAPYSSVEQCLANRKPLLSDDKLQALHAASAGCDMVMYTVILGAYDALDIFIEKQPADLGAAELPGKLCRFALVDKATIAKSKERGYTKKSRKAWHPFAINPLPFPSSKQRSAHGFKAAPWLLFPTAEWIIYLDGKIILQQPVRHMLSNFTALPGKTSLFVLLHPHVIGPRHESPLLEEIVAEKAWITRRKREDFARDVADINHLLRLYCNADLNARYELDICQTSPVIESSLMVWRQPRPSSSCAAAQKLQMELLQCLWLTEIALVSQREQLSFPYVVDVLKAESSIHYIPPEEYKRFWGWRDHKECDARGRCLGRG